MNISDGETRNAYAILVGKTLGKRPETGGYLDGMTVLRRIIGIRF
jgi:hypothetical protein